MAVTTASDRLAIEHQKDVAGVAGGVASAVIQTAMGADPAAISTWFFSALDGLMARIQAGYAINRRSAMGYLPQHGALNRVTVSPVPGSLDAGSSRARLNITGPVAFKRAIGAGFDQQQALRSMATQMGGVADELVRNGDRDVIIQTIRRGRGLVAYRRRLAGKSCGFCAMLASRGAVYSAETVNFRTHPSCNCFAEPVYRREREPVEVQRLQRQWSRVTAGKSGKDAQRAWRRHWEQRATPAARAREGIAELIPAPMAAAQGALDPALKLTVAQLKTIANSNSVRIVGLRTKQDILATLRNHEDVHKVKLAGLPEWKPPRPVLGADIDAPPLGVPAADRVLTGAALNNWADYFKYDRELKRFQLVDANGNTPPEGIRVHNLRANVQGGFQTGFNEYMVHDGTAFSFDGVAYLIEHRADQFGSPWVSKTLADLRAAHEDIPGAKLANKSYAALGGENPADGHWRVKYNNPDHTSIAMAGDGRVTLWLFRGPVTPGGLYSRVPIDTLRHETGHNLDDLVGRTTKGSESAAWRDAAKADASTAAKIRDLSDEIPGHGDFAKVEAGRGFPEGVTDYGRSSVVEDYAESVRLYQQGVIAQGRLTAGAEKGPVWFRDLYPARAEILDDLFPDLARAQKAEIAALRAPKPVPKAAADLSKLKVTELRALAKERGITGYSKLTKPQLLEKLGGKAEVKAAAKAPEKDLVTLARQRQADIDYARARAELLSETEEWLNNQGTMASMAIQLRRDALRYGIEGHKDMAALFRAIDAGDEAKVRKAIEAVAKKQKLTRIDRAGEIVKFDRSLHGDIGKDLKPGEWAIVVRPGYTFDRNGELIRLHKAKVEKATAQEIASLRAAKQADINKIPASAPRRISAKVRAELDSQAQLVPRATEQLGSIEIASDEEWARLVASGSAEEKFWAGYQPGQQRVVFSPRWRTDAAELAKRLSRAYESGDLAWSFPEFSFRNLDVAAGILRHEFGHHVASIFPGAAGKWSAEQVATLISPLASELGVAGPGAARDIAAWFGRNEVRNAIIGKVSKRAADGFDEMLAEIWAQYSGRGEKASALARRIGSVLRDAWA